MKCISKIHLLPLVMCLGLNLMYAQIDNTIDLSNETPLNTNSTYNIKDNTQDSKNQAKTSTQSQNAQQTRTVQENYATYELGIGYIYGSFKAKQSINYLNFSTQGQANGVEIFANSNYYFNKNVGLMFGLGAEFLPIYWDTPIADYDKAYKSDFLLTIAPYIGGFYDINILSHSTLRLFGNVGLGLNYQFGGAYNGSISCSTLFATAYCYSAPKIKTPISVPIALGVRYIFATHHGIEAIFRLNPLDINYELKGYGISLKTAFSRPFSFGLRYVYEFK